MLAFSVASRIDSDDIVAKTSRAKRRVLTKIAAFVRRRAIFSLRRRKSSSASGSPPSVHSRDDHASLRNIRFEWDGDSVIIGTVGLGSAARHGAIVPNDTVPALMELGGTATVTEEEIRPGRWVRARATRRRSRPLQRRSRTLHYPARPYIGPALAAERDNFASLWEDAL